MSDLTTPPLSIRLLGMNEAPLYQQLRLQALQTDAPAFLNTLETEQFFSPQRYVSEMLYARQKPPYGYYGAFVPDFVPGFVSNSDTSAADEHTAEKLVGYVQIAPSGLDKQKHVAFIYNLFVAPEYRHQGIARRLVEHVLGLLKHYQLELVLVNCVASNTSACTFYQQVGFVQHARRPGSVKWQGQYDDELEFALRLK